MFSHLHIKRVACSETVRLYPLLLKPPFFATYNPNDLAVHPMYPSIVKKLKNMFPKAVLTGLLTGCALIGAPNPAQAYTPAYSNPDPSSAFQPTTPTQPGSFGFWFDTDRDVTIDGLGFSNQPTNWGSGTSYEVWLWSYTNGGTAIGDFTLIDKVTFTEGNTYELQGAYFWQSIPLVTLTDSTTGDPTLQNGFVIGVVGDFSNNPGNVGAEGTLSAVNFLPGIVIDIGTQNFGVPSPDPFFPVPVYDSGFGASAWFNGNLSIAPIPGPLPMLGAAAGFAWSRRLRKRIQATK